MTSQSFVTEIEKFIYQDIMKTVNRLTGVSKTSFLSTGLMLKLSLQFEAVEACYDEDPDQTFKTVTDLNDVFNSTISSTDPTKIVFSFVYTSEKHLKKIYKLAVRNPTFFSFHYLKQLQHTLRQHNTLAYNQMMMRIVGDKAEAYSAIELTKTAIVNRGILEVLKLLHLEQELREIQTLYPVADEDQTEIDVLKNMSANLEDLKVTKLAKYLKKINIRGKTLIADTKLTLNFGEDEHGYSKGLGKQDAQVVALSEQLYTDIATNTKGTAVGVLYNQILNSVQTDTKWFKKLAKSFARQVYERTNMHEASWANINSTYRHIYTAPMHKHIKKTIKLILSIDNSGSMSAKDLQKLLFLFEKHSKRISEIIVYPHTSAVLKEFTIKSDSDISNNPQFAEAIGTRHGDGGTSHMDVFRHISKLNIKNPEDYIYFSFSDNYSDIEDVFYKYPIMKKLKSYFVRPSNGRPVDATKVECTQVVLP